MAVLWRWLSYRGGRLSRLECISTVYKFTQFKIHKMFIIHVPLLHTEEYLCMGSQKSGRPRCMSARKKYTVKLLKIWTPENIAVITLKTEQCGFAVQ